MSLTQHVSGFTPVEQYQHDLQSGQYEHDQVQSDAVDQLQALYVALLDYKRPKQSLLSKVGLQKTKPITPVSGLYFWGGVGRGKTWLVDTFFDCLPFEDKLRMHFHRFMHRVHNELKQLRDEKDPLAIVAEKIASEARILCFDEFVVHDVADAVILARLMQTLFDLGVTLVATSNVAPDDLYKGGLQRDLFLPAIALIKQHTTISNIDSGIDYRLRFLDQAETYISPIDENTHAALMDDFDHLAPDSGEENGEIEVEGRNLNYIKRADGVIWFTFEELCDGPRSQADYLEIALTFQAVVLSDIPVFDRLKEDQARRFINLIDVLYDHSVKLICSAQARPEDLYQGSRVAFEFQRTVSRLIEMQSHDYLALSHKL